MATISKSKLALYLTVPKMKNKIIRELRTRHQGGGDYYVQLKSSIVKLEKSGRILALPAEVRKIKPPEKDPAKIPYLGQCADSYCLVRSDFEVKTVEVIRPARTTSRGNIKVVNSPDIIWHLADGRKVFVAYYLYKPAKDITERCDRKKANLISALVGKSIQFLEGDVFLVIDLAYGRYFCTTDNGSTIWTQLDGALDQIKQALE
jgi:hypothetical protein